MARRRPGTLFPLEIEILECGIALQSSDGDFYGFALAKALAGRADGKGLTAHGTLYKALARMTDAGLLDAVWEDAALAEAAGRPRRRLYTVSGEGVRAHQAATAGAPAAAPSGLAAFA
ncbi:PadR family transcriptional regulator [Microterricola pindariensis]|uniref:Transcription regulator PadR N-terminal domain-containing protein n=1 Tax=Microterricola pindariensis TaxID=478010 RepID=A0ABX5ASK3_9MICO|nr:helix-turn-helix transcriptional regulator [Microterricola pindariensis]PPL14768.1 hypothetical protein GY24_15515 [Microterricola pindariensis]